MDWGQKAQVRLAEIAKCSEPGSGVTRLPFTPEHNQALHLIEGWMKQAGLRVSLDAAGTLVGQSSGTGPALLMGSHQDSVCEAGRYDGIMGIALACLVIEKLREQNAMPAFPVEVLAFADEEGVRFPTALIGPRLRLEFFRYKCVQSQSAGFSLQPVGSAREPLAALRFPKLNQRSARPTSWQVRWYCLH